MTGRIRVQPVDVLRTAEWSFRTDRPTLHLQPHGTAGTFDPFPAYPHDAGAVADAVVHVAGVCPPLWDVDMVVADREDVCRTNGWSSLHEGGRYVDDEWTQNDPVGLILLSGKRIPPHPAMSRYLVAHEYGHQVEWMLNRLRGGKHPTDGTLIAGYTQVRGLPDAHAGTGGRWHDAAAEVFACDFRIVACGVEVEYWPHPGITHPNELPDTVLTWWADALVELAEAAR